MKNEITLSAKTIGNRSTTDKTENIARLADRLVAPLARYYSQVLGIEMTTGKVLQLLNAQAAFFFTVFPAGCHALLRIACGVWLVAALLKCREKAVADN